MANNKTPIKRSPKKMCSNDSSVAPDIELELGKNLNLDKKWREKAEQELGETDEIAKSRINQLRQLLAVSSTIPNGRRDSAFLLRFLRAKKFDIEKALKMVQKYYSMKERSPELFKVSPASELRDLLEMQIQYMVPARDANGRQVYIFRVEKLNPCKCPVETVFRTNVLALENAVREPETQIGGIIVLLDMAGAGLGHAKFLAPTLSRRTVEVIQEAFPLRFKAFHILHEPFYFDAILRVLKPFLKEKIRRRIFLHGNNLTSLHKYIPKEILPSEYGGDLPAFDNTAWREQLLQNESYFMNLESYKITEPVMSSNLENVNRLNSVNNNSVDVEDSRSYDEDDEKNGIPYIDNLELDTETDEDSEFELCNNGGTARIDNLNGNENSKLDKNTIS